MTIDRHTRGARICISCWSRIVRLYALSNQAACSVSAAIYLGSAQYAWHVHPASLSMSIRGRKCDMAALLTLMCMLVWCSAYAEVVHGSAQLPQPHNMADAHKRKLLAAARYQGLLINMQTSEAFLYPQHARTGEDRVARRRRAGHVTHIQGPIRCICCHARLNLFCSSCMCPSTYAHVTQAKRCCCALHCQLSAPTGVQGYIVDGLAVSAASLKALSAAGGVSICYFRYALSSHTRLVRSCRQQLLSSLDMLPAQAPPLAHNALLPSLCTHI
jgi:hypothetical protein